MTASFQIGETLYQKIVTGEVVSYRCGDGGCAFTIGREYDIDQYDWHTTLWDVKQVSLMNGKEELWTGKVELGVADLFLHRNQWGLIDALCIDSFYYKERF